MTLLKGGGGSRFRPITLEKRISSQELEGKARTRPDILRVVLGPYVQYCPCEALGEKVGQNPKSELKNRAKLLSPFDLSSKNEYLRTSKLDEI